MFSSRAGRGAPVLLLCAGLLLTAACSGGSDAKAAKADAPKGTTLTVEAAEPVQVAAAGAPGTLSDADRDAIVDTTRRYVIAGTINPLQGKPVGDLAKLFTPAAVAALAGPDRSAALDEGLPKATGQIDATAEPLTLVALSDPTGAIDLVGTTLSLDVKAKAAGGPVRVKRIGELVLTKDDGTWKINSYRLTAARTGTGIPTATTTTTGKTP